MPLKAMFQLFREGSGCPATAGVEPVRRGPYLTQSRSITDWVPLFRKVVEMTIVKLAYRFSGSLPSNDMGNAQTYPPAPATKLEKPIGLTGIGRVKRNVRVDALAQDSTPRSSA
jgi:hypothetical protein